MNRCPHCGHQLDAEGYGGILSDGAQMLRDGKELMEDAKPLVKEGRQLMDELNSSWPVMVLRWLAKLLGVKPKR